MDVIKALTRRYATKRMTGQTVPGDILNTILEAIRLSPSSLGLQPYEVFVITNRDTKDHIRQIAFNQPQVTECSHLLVFAAWDRYTDERIDAAFDLLAIERNLPAEDVNAQKSSAKKYFREKSAEFHSNHAAKQSAIALGIALVTAALEGIDAAAMEGFNPAALDEYLKLADKGLRSATLMALGYRDEVNDWNVRLKKVRKPLNELVTIIN